MKSDLKKLIDYQNIYGLTTVTDLSSYYLAYYFSLIVSAPTGYIEFVAEDDYAYSHHTLHALPSGISHLFIHQVILEIPSLCCDARKKKSSFIVA